MSLKKALLDEIKQEVQMSANPEATALQLLNNAKSAQSRFDGALKRPQSNQKTTSNKRVSFASESQNNQTNQTQSTQNLDNTLPKGDNNKSVKSNEKKSSNSNNDNSVRTVEKIRPTEPKKQQSIQKDQKESKQPAESKEQKVTSKKSDVNEEQEVRQSRFKEQLEQSHGRADKSVSTDEEIDKQHKHHRHHHHHHRKQRKDRSLSQSRDNKDSKDNERQEMEIKLMKQIQDYLSTIRRLETNVRLLEQANAASEEINKNLTTNLENLVGQFNQEEQLRVSQIQQLRMESLQMKEEIQGQSLTILEKNQLEAFLKRQNQQLIQQNEALIEKEGEMNQKLSNLQMQLDQAKLKFIDKDALSERLEIQNQQLIQNLALFQSQYKEACEENRRLIKQVSSVENENVRLQAELTNVKHDTLDSSQIQTDRIDKLRYDNEQLRIKQMKHDEILDVVKRERDQWKSDYEILQMNRSEIEVLKKRLQLKEAELEQIQADNDKLKWKIRKDPNGVLSDLRSMSITVTEKIQPEPQPQISQTKEQELLDKILKLQNEKRQLNEDYEILRKENRNLLQQLEQNDITMTELRNMFARERNHLEQQLQLKDRHQVLWQHEKPTSKTVDHPQDDKGGLTGDPKQNLQKGGVDPRQNMTQPNQQNRGGPVQQENEVLKTQSDQLPHPPYYLVRHDPYHNGKNFAQQPQQHQRSDKGEPIKRVKIEERLASTNNQNLNPTMTTQGTHEAPTFKSPYQIPSLSSYR